MGCAARRDWFESSPPDEVMVLQPGLFFQHQVSYVFHPTSFNKFFLTKISYLRHRGHI